MRPWMPDQPDLRAPLTRAKKPINVQNGGYACGLPGLPGLVVTGGMRLW